jgi:hypothetical protein
MIITAIDPGKTGFLVELNSDTKTAKTMRLPFRPDEILCYRTIRANFDLKTADMVILEKVSANPRWGTSACLTFGKTVGQIQMLISTANFFEISSKTWQKVMHLGFSDSMESKEKSLAAFYRINPDYPTKPKPDHNMIDAFLMADYGLRKNGVMVSQEWRFEHVKGR